MTPAIEVQGELHSHYTLSVLNMTLQLLLTV